eukprot:TRINITY_DN23923_c0_g1_i1.p1 TRINITY_DN23923_c0_g1~~TRINITY_DN23923_c0_g1_i1.p1  ORF type:complete len:300 (-),score=61.75 TRINITY_DN23923_c0_g1_i1:160-1059(-)
MESADARLVTGSANMHSSRPSTHMFTVMHQRSQADSLALQPWRRECENLLEDAGGWGLDWTETHPPAALVESVTLGQSKHGVKVLDGVFPPEWCEGFIAKHEQIGFTAQHRLDALTPTGQTMQQLHRVSGGAYGTGKNTSEVLQLESLDLASVLWERVREHVPLEMVEGSGFLRGRFQAVGVLPVFRFMKYRAGQQFKAHHDPSRSLLHHPVTGAPGYYKSFFTIACYLNSPQEFQGGALSFLRVLVCPKRYQVEAEVIPAVGRCAVFEHGELHEAGVVLGGNKHMMQCDVLYEWLGPE